MVNEVIKWYTYQSNGMILLYQYNIANNVRM